MQGKRFVYFKVLMIATNLIAVMFITVFIYVTTQKICNNYIAREFINTVNALPGKPSRNIYISVLLFLILIFFFYSTGVFLSQYQQSCFFNAYY